VDEHLAEEIARDVERRTIVEITEEVTGHGRMSAACQLRTMTASAEATVVRRSLARRRNVELRRHLGRVGSMA
jgi:hypothetical protein